VSYPALKAGNDEEATVFDLLSSIVQVLGTAMTFLKSALSDITHISFRNMPSLDWLWTHKLFAGVALITGRTRQRAL